MRVVAERGGRGGLRYCDTFGVHRGIVRRSIHTVIYEDPKVQLYSNISFCNLFSTRQHVNRKSLSYSPLGMIGRPPPPFTLLSSKP